MPRTSSLPASANTLTLQALKQSPEPLTAYQILKSLKKQGVRSAPIVYRALDTLQKEGLVHRVERLNAYLPCNHAHPHPLSIITVCDSCQQTSELHDYEISSHIEKLNEMGLTLAEEATFELPVLCAPCQDKQAA